MRPVPAVSSVSVVVPCFDSAHFVIDAVTSLLESRSVVEVIVVDDGSTDDPRHALDRISEPRLRVVSQANAGAAAARNRGIALARAHYLAFLDADDLRAPGTITKQVAILEQDRHLDLVFGHAADFDHDTGAVRPTVPGYSSGTMVVRRAAFDRVGPFATTWRVGEFIDWYARATDAGLRSTMIDDIVLHRRIHSTNLTRSSTHDIAAVVAAIHRRRRTRPSVDAEPTTR